MFLNSYGNQAHLSQFEGKVIILNLFTANDRNKVDIYFSGIESYVLPRASRDSGKDIVALYVSVDDHLVDGTASRSSFMKIEKFFNEDRGESFKKAGESIMSKRTYYVDVDRKFSQAFYKENMPLPYFLIINADGKISGYAIGDSPRLYKNLITFIRNM